MLTADLVQAYRRGDRLTIRKLDKRAETSALAFAELYLNIARQHIGASKAEFNAACKAVPVHVRDKKLAAGLLKLVQDRCMFEMGGDVDAGALRKAVFTAASRMRQQADRMEEFNRTQLLEDAGKPFNLTHEAVEQSLFGDLKGAHLLTQLKDTTPNHLLTEYGRSQEQAMLLKATHVTVVVKPSGAPLLRKLFHKLKFLRLIHVIHPLTKGRYQIEIDGPFSLFTAVTKYGLQLALLLPILDEVGPWQLTADVRHGKDKRSFRFQTKGGGTEIEKEADTFHLSDDTTNFIKRFKALDTPWTITPATDILEVKGLGLTIPDLLFTHSETGEVAYFEVMGFWSRQAVWKRIELVEAGLAVPVIFAISKRLRVSESVLDEELPSTLYVYKGVMNAAKVADILEKKFSSKKA